MQKQVTFFYMKIFYDIKDLFTFFFRIIKTSISNTK